MKTVKLLNSVITNVRKIFLTLTRNFVSIIKCAYSNYTAYEPNIVVIRQIRPLNINEIEAVFKSEPYNNYLRNGLSQHIDINAKYVYKNE